MGGAIRVKGDAETRSFTPAPDPCLTPLQTSCRRFMLVNIFGARFRTPFTFHLWALVVQGEAWPGLKFVAYRI